MKLLADIKDNKLIINDDISKYNDKRVIVEIKEKKDDRSIEQNKYYWGVLIPCMCQAYGDNDTMYIHELLKQKFIVKISETGKVYSGSTTNLNVNEFWKYCNNVEMLIYELKGEIPQVEYENIRSYIKGA